MTKLVINQCPIHRNYWSVAIRDDNSGTRVTTGKCCGRWHTVQEWDLSVDDWEDLAKLATKAAEEKRALKGDGDMSEKYAPTTLHGALGHLTEEAGEVITAVGKTQRWGHESVNPELPPDHQERNGDWVLRELRDLKAAIQIAEKFLMELGYTGGAR